MSVLTARRTGATVVTTNVADFDLVRAHVPFTVLAADPLPAN